jgi:hypothetical protein
MRMCVPTCHDLEELCVVPHLPGKISHQWVVVALPGAPQQEVLSAQFHGDVEGLLALGRGVSGNVGVRVGGGAVGIPERCASSFIGAALTNIRVYFEFKCLICI